jgi:putative ATP-dependent endonuclease of the OLD family
MGSVIRGYCVIGPGDSGKSTVLDAIDLCLGARRNAHFTDADFHGLDVTKPLTVALTLGELDDALKSMEGYGLFLRGFDPETGEVEDEPEKAGETVLTLRMTVSSDLEPSWTLYSDRAAAQDVTRGLTWGDRIRLAPTRIGVLADINLGWARGSVLNRLSEERPELSAALAKAARDARMAFGDEVEQQLGGTLEIVNETARRLGIPVGEVVRATLGAHDVSFRGGTISLHDEAGVPLRSLGIGSIRLLIAGLQRAAAQQSTIILVDELEHGLEPHRIKRFLDSLGAKEASPVQVFATTHSPVAVRELSGDQLYVLRRSGQRHEARVVGIDDAIQSTVRLYPDAFLAPSVLVCEGASEAGLLRGLDQYRVDQGMSSLNALGVALVDSGGAEKIHERASAFDALGYHTAVLRDDDMRPPLN